jgi:hypothetical protein
VVIELDGNSHIHFHKAMIRAADKKLAVHHVVLALRINNNVRPPRVT